MSVGVGAKVGAPKRNKKASKKKKASWRKNTDLDDVEEFLEDQRIEDRLGGAFRHRKDEELFALDSQGQKDEGDGDGDGEGSHRLRRRRRIQEEPLKCFSHLEIKIGAKDPKGRNDNIGKKKQKLKEKSLQIRAESKVGPK